MRHLHTPLFGACLVAGTLLLSACTPSQEPPVAQDTSEVSAPADGPRAAADRPLASTTVFLNEEGTARISEVDLGNVEESGYTTPARGVLVTPTSPIKEMPLIIASHLRAPGCGELEFAYPCADGSEPTRFDRGMIPLAERLAEAGYSVLIPDVTGVFVGADVDKPYDQAKMWNSVIGKLVDAVTTDTTGETDIFQSELADRIDTQTIGLMLHSRSASLANSAAEFLGADKVKSILTYGGAYDTFDKESFSPPVVDIPYLGIVGELDGDVAYSAHQWLSEYLEQPRQNPAQIAVVPGFGHLLINQAAIEKGQDDRIGCETLDCPNGEEHQRFVAQAAADWFNTSIKEIENEIAWRNEQLLPPTLAGVPVRWLAATPGPQVTRIPATAFTPTSPNSATQCHHIDPMSPSDDPAACPLPENGVVYSVADIIQLGDATATTTIPHPTTMAIHLNPIGDADDPSLENQLVVELELDDGQRIVQRLTADDSPLRNLATPEVNGTYITTTIRLPIGDLIAGRDVVSIKLATPNGGKTVEVLGVDFS